MLDQAPALTLLLIAITCAVSYQGFKSGAFQQRFIFDPQAILAGKEYHRIVTSAFLHADWRHLIFNMISLFIFGRNLELFLGKTQFLLIYFSSIIGGDLLSLYVHRHHDYRSYGASGGVCGVIFANILLNPWGGIGSFYVPIPIPGWIYGILYIGYSFFGMKEHRGDMGHDAHLGGAIIGFLTTAALNPWAVRLHWPFFIGILAIASSLLVYLWMNPLFLPLSALFSRSPRIKSQDLPAYKRRTLQIDSILEKIAKSGIDSLDPEERKLLAEESKRQQRRSDSKKPESGLAI
jgi:membrane associated rhomboid family serine protease